MPRTPDYTRYGFSDSFNEIPSQQRDQKGLGTVPFVEILVSMVSIVVMESMVFADNYGFYGNYQNCGKSGNYKARGGALARRLFA